ncbi:MAG TPA: thioesterase family protein [Bacteroidota bacterium]
MDRSQFKHKTQVRVRNYEVDWQGIVHNANYLLYCEVGRIEYLKELGATVNIQSINGGSKVVLVRNEIDYKSSAVFDELLDVFTRVSFIRNTSFAMESVIEKATTSELVVTNTAFHVWLDPITNAPVTVGREFRNQIRQFEGEDCEIEWTHNPG